MEAAKAKNKESFISNQFLILEQLESLKKASGKEMDIPEQKKCMEYTFVILILSGQAGKIVDGQLIFSGAEVGINKCFSYPVEDLKKYNFLSEKITEFENPAYNDDVSESVEEQNSSVSSMEVTIMEDNSNPLNKTDGVYLAKQIQKDIEEKSSNEIIPNKSDKEKVQKPDESNNNFKNLIFGLYEKETQIMPHAETAEYKYLDTMWFHHYHVTCSVKDGYMPEEFDFVIYPMELAEQRTPVMIAVALKYKNHKKVAFSENNKHSIEINFEDYIFAVTVRFVNGQLNSKLTLCSEQYEIINIQQDCYQSSSIIPEHFYKEISFGKDKLEIYPLELTNDEVFGCVNFMYRYIMDTGEIITGVSDDEDYTLTVALSEGGAKKIYCYWEGKDADQRLMVKWD